MKIVATFPPNAWVRTGKFLCGVLLLGGLMGGTLLLQSRQTAALRQFVALPAAETAAETLPDDSTVETAASPEASEQTVSAAEMVVDEATEAVMAQPVMQWSSHVSSGYGVRDNPLQSGDELHAGIDIAVNEGTAVFAALDGTVRLSEQSDTGYGNQLVLDHADGTATRYAHCSTLLCKEGDTVRKGDLIALVGSTGNSTGPHLHFEVLQNGAAVDPTAFLTTAEETP